MMPSTGHTQIPIRFGNYDLLERLGGGGMADVYRACDTVMGKIVAIKVLKPKYAADEEFKTRFLDEARTVAPLRHPHIIEVFGVGEVDGLPCMIMRFLPGHDLRAYMNQATAITLLDKLQIAVQTAEAIEYIHAHDIVHRDIKPENIFVDTSGQVCLIDFGIAKSELSTTKTQAGFAVGTFAYMAPEQLRCAPASKLVDIYAFGLVLYEMVALQGATVEEAHNKILQKPLDLDLLRCAGTPEPVIDLIRCCTAIEPERRPQSFSTIRKQLLQVIEGLAPAPAPVPLVRRRVSLPVWAYVGAVVILLVAALAVWIMGHGGRSTMETTAELKAKPRVDKPVPPVLGRYIDDATGDMVLVPEGNFKFGQPGKFVDKFLPAFYIDKTEVTNKAYAKYTAAQHVLAPKGRPEDPVVSVTAADARGFCQWAGKRLPSMYEWEKAARGDDGREYPWGNAPDASRANVNSRKLMPADAFPEGASPWGALQMAGNAWEFVGDTRLPTAEEIGNAREDGRANAHSPWPMIYGGCFDLKLKSAKLWDSAVVPPKYKLSTIGFRCAKTP